MPVGKINGKLFGLVWILKFMNCGREVMIDRLEFIRKLKKVLGEENEEKKS